MRVAAAYATLILYLKNTILAPIYIILRFRPPNNLL